MIPPPLFSPEEARRLFLWIDEATGTAAMSYLPPDLIERLKSLVGLWARELTPKLTEGL